MKRILLSLFAVLLGLQCGSSIMASEVKTKRAVKSNKPHPASPAQQLVSPAQQRPTTPPSPSSADEGDEAPPPPPAEGNGVSATSQSESLRIFIEDNDLDDARSLIAVGIKLTTKDFDELDANDVYHERLQRLGLTPPPPPAEEKENLLPSIFKLLETILVPSGNINERDEQGRTLLMLAAAHGRPELVATIVRAGGDKDAVDSNGHNVSWYAQQNPEHAAAIRKTLEQEVPAAPAAPQAPVAPAAPEAPEAPAAPEAPEAPSAPEAPTAPIAPAPPSTLPTAPKKPATPSSATQKTAGKPMTLLEEMRQKQLTKPIAQPPAKPAQSTKPSPAGAVSMADIQAGRAGLKPTGTQPSRPTAEKPLMREIKQGIALTPVPPQRKEPSSGVGGIISPALQKRMENEAKERAAREARRKAVTDDEWED